MKVILNMVITVNGLIAKENDEAPWSDTIWKNYYKTGKKIRNIIVGRKTYELMKEVNEFEKLGNPLTVVLTSKPLKGNENLFFVSSPKKALEIIKNKGYKKTLLGGGAKTTSAFMKEGLVDELVIQIEPMLFGKGIKLFSDADFEAKLKLLDVKHLSKNELELRYKVLK